MLVCNQHLVVSFICKKICKLIFFKMCALFCIHLLLSRKVGAYVSFIQEVNMTHWSHMRIFYWSYLEIFFWVHSWHWDPRQWQPHLSLSSDSNWRTGYYIVMWLAAVHKRICCVLGNTWSGMMQQSVALCNYEVFKDTENSGARLLHSPFAQH